MLNHAYIMRIHQVYEGEQRIYLVFELMGGKESFERVIARKAHNEKKCSNSY